MAHIVLNSFIVQKYSENNLLPIKLFVYTRHNPKKASLILTSEELIVWLLPEVKAGSRKVHVGYQCNQHECRGPR